MQFAQKHEPIRLSRGAPPGARALRMKPSAAVVFYGVPQAEIDALLAFYAATDGDNWTDNAGWNDFSYIGDWYGVTVTAGHVTGLDLTTNNLVGAAADTLADLPYLNRLVCYGNSLTTLDITANTALTVLSCFSNSLAVLDVSANVLLVSLACSGNPLTTLDVSTNTALTYLSCFSNLLTALDVTKNINLVTLQCYSNSLTVLDVSLNTGLTSLRCQDNDLTSLDMSANTLLTVLWCHFNPLTTLNVASCINLDTLLCYSSSLATLDVSANVALTVLYCYSSLISAFNVSANILLRAFKIYSNGMDEANIDLLVSSIYTARANYTFSNPVADIGGTNADPSGIYQENTPPASGLEEVWKLENYVAGGFNLWTITY